MSVDFCGATITFEWSCDECGYIWQTESWEGILKPLYSSDYPDCPNCSD